MKREKLGTRLGFILLSAGCAIGIGNVYRFPYVAGQNGGAVFVFLYLLFLALMGIPIMTMEFAVGRASQKSIIVSFRELEKPGDKWHIHGYFGMFGNYCLMMFYTVIAGWMIYYFYHMLIGTFEGMSASEVENVYTGMLSKPVTMEILAIVVIVTGFGICSFGLQKGVERITKIMMVLLLLIMVVLAVNSVRLDGGGRGIEFYLKPDFEKVKKIGFFNVVVEAMNQSLFTLSLGIGAMAVFGSYIGKEHTLLKESVNVAVLDTFVAIVAGFIVFPACFAFGVNPDSGPKLLYITLPNVFNVMKGGRVWGVLFFIFMGFAAFSTVLAVFENIISCCKDLWGWTRKKACLVNTFLVTVLSLPCVLGFNVWSGVHPLGAGTNILDLEDFIVSNILLPAGSIVYILFCVTRYGWGFNAYQKEVNAGKGIKLPGGSRFYLVYILPVFIIFLWIRGIITRFI